MPRYGKFILGVGSMLLFLVGLAGNGYAHDKGVSQYVVVRSNGDRRPAAYNPGRSDLFVVQIIYDGDGPVFDSCFSEVLTSHDTDSASYGFGPGASDSSHSDFIAAISGQRVGARSHNVGILVSAGKKIGQPVDHYLFNISDPDAIACVCGELAGAGESPLLFAGFGIRC